MEQTLSLGCLVMAAGSGRRFGGNKLAAELDGKTLIRRALEAVPGARFSAVTVVSQYEDIEELAGQFGFAAIHNDRPDLGLSHTIRIGTEAMRTCDGILYMVADQPKLCQETVARIVEVFCQHPDRIVGAGHEGRRGNPRLLPHELRLFSMFSSLSFPVLFASFSLYYAKTYSAPIIPQNQQFRKCCFCGFVYFGENVQGCADFVCKTLPFSAKRRQNAAHRKNRPRKGRRRIGCGGGAWLWKRSNGSAGKMRGFCWRWGPCWRSARCCR